MILLSSMLTSLHLSQTAISFKLHSVSLLSLMVTNSKIRSYLQETTLQASQDKVCEAENQVEQVVKHFLDLSKWQSMWTSLQKRLILQSGWIWDSLAIHLHQARSLSSQWLRWATTSLHSHHAVQGNLSTKPSNLTTQVTLQSNLRFCKTPPALISHSQH